MSSWSSRRKALYGGSITVLILCVVLFVIFSFFYKSPTCSDGKKNGNELGIDCGGSCVKLCQSAFLPPQIFWGGGKFEEMAPHLYNLSSYIVNPNTDVSALNVPYKFSLYDSDGLLILDKNGYVSIPAHRNVLAFESAVDVQERIPAKVTFEFTGVPEWFKSKDELSGLSIIDKKYTENNEGSSLEVTLENRSLLPYENLDVYVVLYDSDKNAIGFSKTKIDEIKPNGGREVAPFTWPNNRNGRVSTIEVMPVLIPVREK